MATQSYPLDLRTVIRASKNRSQPAAFTHALPRRGMPYARAVGTVAPEQWSVQFRFTRSEATVFKLWFETVLQRGELPFNMFLRTEAGSVEHELQFLPDGLGDCMEEGETFVYDAQFIGAPL